MSRKSWGICWQGCNKWGEAPQEFKENRHFLKCECGNIMSLTHLDPKDAAYPEKDKINNITIVNQY